MTDRPAINRDTVQELATVAQLPLAPERVDKLVSQLASWLTAANELNTKMSDSAHWMLAPVTVFTHPGCEGMKE